MIEKKGYSNKVICMGGFNPSNPAPDSFDTTMRSMLEPITPSDVPTESGTVNILGLTVMHKGWKDSLAELEGLLGLMGLKVLASPGTETSVDLLRRSMNASFNIVVSPEYCMKTAEWYRDTFGIPFFISPLGAPIGFDAIEGWLTGLASATDKDPTHALSVVLKARKRAYSLLKIFHAHTDIPRGATFSIQSISSSALPISHWLMDYLGMSPVWSKSITDLTVPWRMH